MAFAPTGPAPSSAPPLPRGWLIVALLCFVGCLNYLDRIMLTTMRGSIVEAIPMTDAQFGLLTAVFLWMYAALSPLAGFLADRFSRSRVIITSLFVWSAVTWATAHARTYEELLLTRALMGLSEACYLPAALALIADYHRGATRSFATSIHMGGVMVGTGMGGIGGWIAEQRGWDYAFSVFGIIGVLYSLVLVFLLRDAPRDRGETAVALAGADQKVSFGNALVTLLKQKAFIIALGWSAGPSSAGCQPTSESIST